MVLADEATLTQSLTQTLTQRSPKNHLLVCAAPTSARPALEPGAEKVFLECISFKGGPVSACVTQSWVSSCQCRPQTHLSVSYTQL